MPKMITMTYHQRVVADLKKSLENCVGTHDSLREGQREAERKAVRWESVANDWRVQAANLASDLQKAREAIVAADEAANHASASYNREIADLRTENQCLTQACAELQLEISGIRGQTNDRVIDVKEEFEAVLRSKQRDLERSQEMIRDRAIECQVQRAAVGELHNVIRSIVKEIVRNDR